MALAKRPVWKETEAGKKALRGELYHAFTPELIAARSYAEQACHRFNDARNASRRRKVELWRDVVGDSTPLPLEAATKEEDDALFEDDPWVEAPIRADYGNNIRMGPGVFVNYGSVFIDTCPITISARTLVAPNVSFYSGTHPLDPAVRNGTQGPELGKEISVGEDCWIGGMSIILPGVKIGRGCVVGAGSVVTKDVPDFHVVAGNPARILRKIETSMDPESKTAKSTERDRTTTAEVLMSQEATRSGLQ